MAKYSEEIINQILSLYQEGNNYVNIANILHINRAVVSKYVREAGLATLKPNSGKIDLYNNLFNEINTEELAYWLGYLYADGHLEKNTNRIQLGSIDKEQIEKFKAFVGSDNEISHETFPENLNKNDYYRFKFSNKIVYNNLIKLGCLQKKSLVLTCPNEKQVPQHLFKHFVRGYIDGDGSMRYRDCTPRLNILGTKEFLLGIQQRMKWDYQEPKPKNNIFVVEYNGREKALKYLKELYLGSSIYLERKYQKVLKIIEILK